MIYLPPPHQRGQRAGTEPGEEILTKATDKGSTSLVRD